MRVSTRRNPISEGLRLGPARMISRPQLLSVLALVVVAVLVRADRLPPPGVVAIPLDYRSQSLLEPDLGHPAEIGRFLRGERVAAVVAQPVLDVLDQRLVATGELQDLVNDVDVGQLIRAADVVCLSCLSAL